MPLFSFEVQNSKGATNIHPQTPRNNHDKTSSRLIIIIRDFHNRQDAIYQLHKAHSASILAHVLRPLNPPMKPYSSANANKLIVLFLHTKYGTTLESNDRLKLMIFFPTYMSGYSQLPDYYLIKSRIIDNHMEFNTQRYRITFFIQIFRKIGYNKKNRPTIKKLFE